LTRRSWIALAALAMPLPIASACSDDPGGGDAAGSGGKGGGGATSSATSGGPPECTTDSQCASDPPCTMGTCFNGRCVIVKQPDGPAPGVKEEPHDCIHVRCEQGKRVVVQDESEKPDDSNECTIESCTAGASATKNAPAGTPCAAGECNDSGQCTGCSVPDDCGSMTFCRARTCVDSICGLDEPSKGTPLPDEEQKAGDCKRSVCDGNGGVDLEDDDDDVPVDDDPCTKDVCEKGAPGNPLEDAGTPCGEDAGVCSKEGKCVECVTDDQCTAPDTCGAVVPNQCACKKESKAFTCNGHCATVTGNCGQTEECGDCKNGATCVDSSCCYSQPKSFACSGVACGSVLDNCGKSVLCEGSCTAPETCGGGGTPNVCGCTDDGSACQGKNCGSATNNCGAAVTCAPNSCAAPETCAGGGVANVCGCTDDGAACQGKECGPVTNNCGRTVSCAPDQCAAPTTCGGGGVANRCGCTDDGSACQGKQCGSVTNNCGQTVTCPPDSCPAGTICGVVAPNVCGNGG